MDELHLDNLKIDSLVDLLKASFALEDWDKMIEIANKLYLSARDFEQERQMKDKPERHLVYYFGFSQLAKGIALQNKGDYKKSKALIEKYSDLSWLDDGSKEAKEEIDFFKMFAKANMYAVNVLEGNLEYLEPYIQFLRESRIDELMPGLLNIIEAAMRYNFDVSEILESFESEINTAIEYYKKKQSLYLMKVFYRLSLYHFARKDYDVAIDITLQALALSNILKDTTAFKKFSTLFESFRKHTSEDQQKQYTLFMTNTLKEELSNEKSIFYDGNCIGVN
ncbi:hypothetical protein V3851_10695 [Paenibacillus sp. M1]|uniref:DNA-binding protein n=1 Tax=Paenibacillus haidiansis TaxID=1574488 RepID=A0ABU7VTQ3_9BACL